MILDIKIKNKDVLLSLIFIFVFLYIPIVSSFEFDNIKTYDKETKTAIIKNSFGLGSEIAKIKLDTPLNVYVMPGKNRKVAEFTINTKQLNYNNPLNEIEFYHINQNLKKFEREFKYKYKQVTGYKNVSDYATSCKPVTINKNVTTECSREIIGSHLEEEFVWNELNKIEKLPKDNITIGIFTEVKNDDYVEWIPTFYGIKISEWASWTSSLSEGLMGYYPLDNYTNYVNPSYLNLTSGVHSSVNFTSWNCFKGGCVSFYGYNESLRLQGTSALNINNKNLTINMWVKPLNASVFRVLFYHCRSELCNTNQYDNRHFNMEKGEIMINDGFINGTIGGGAGIKTSNTTGFSMITYTRNSSNYGKFYVNGSLTVYGQAGTPFNSDTGWLFGTTEQNQLNLINPLLIDEIGIWNRTLSSSEISDIYNNGLGLSPVNETETIFINLISPPNNHKTINSSQIFNIEAIWNTPLLNLTNISVFVWNESGSIIKTNSSSVSGKENSTNLTISGLPFNNTLVWNGYACGLNSSGGVSCSFNAVNYTLSKPAFILNDFKINNRTTIGVIESFSLNITIGDNFNVEGNLFYNNTNYGLTTNDIETSKTIFLNKNITILPQYQDTNNSVLFQLKFYNSSNSYYFNQSIGTQEVISLNIDNCTVNTINILNLTNYDEETLKFINGSEIETAINIYDISRDNLILNISTKRYNPLKICINNVLNNQSSYSLDLIIKYFSTEHDIEYYHIVNDILNNTYNKNISLYDLNLSYSIPFKIKFTDPYLTPISDALVYIERQYISENTFKVVEIPKLDSKGETVGHFVKNDVIYNLKFIKNGVILAEFKNIIAFCDDYLSGNCVLSFSSVSDVENIFSYEELNGLKISPILFNSTSNLITFSFVSIDGLPKNLLMNVTVNDIFGNNSICLDSLNSISGTLTCNVGSINSKSVTVDIFSNGIQILKGVLNLESENYGNIGFLIWIVLIFVLTLSFIENKSLVLIGLGISFISAIGLGISSGNITGLASSGMVLITVIIVGLWKLNKENIQ